MNETQVLRELTADLQRARAGRVVYLEGKTDAPIFFALLGVPPPRNGLHQDVLVRGLSGATHVRTYVEVAQRNGRPYAGVCGITDGDGEGHATLAARFAPPFLGPCFSWPAYSIENMLVRTGWPAAWGTAPDWSVALLAHVPYVALNRLHRELLQSLRTLRLAAFSEPKRDEPMKTVHDVAAALAQDKHLIEEYEVEVRFQQEVAAVEAAMRRSLDEAHALVNGKWLVDVFAPRALGPAATPPRCRDEWIAHAVAAGGLPEVRDLWQRITGRPP